MKIGILTLPIDNNYGGNLQRYALCKVLIDLGYNIKHINLISKSFLPWYKKPYSYTKRLILKYLFKKPIVLNIEKYTNKKILSNLTNIQQFYNKYIPHSKQIFNKNDLLKLCKREKFDAIIVGSDQVWRKDMTKQLGIEFYMLEFVKNKKKIAYAASFGTDTVSLQKNELKKLSKLYKKFDLVSLREVSALTLCQKYNWQSPLPKLVLDPTLLLSAEHYRKLFTSQEIKNYTSNKIYCYVLDKNKDVQNYIENLSKKYNYSYIIESFNDISKTVTIEQWLNNINNAKFVVTDSYHGIVFSIIFNKSFFFTGNNRRGNTRLKSLFSILEISENDDIIEPDWNLTNKKIEILKTESINFLKQIKEL